MTMLKTILIVLVPVTMVPAIYADRDTTKDLCEKNDGNWEDKTCDFATDDEFKADRYLDDLQKIEDFEDDKAALEDDLCEDPDAKFDICNTGSQFDDDNKLVAYDDGDRLNVINGDYEDENEGDD